MKKKVLWVVKTNVLSWVIQGVLIGGLTVVGMEWVQAMITAKAAAYTVFVGQLVQAARGR